MKNRLCHAVTEAVLIGVMIPSRVNEGKPKLKYYLFVKKSDDEGISYVFLGECFVIKNSMKQESRLIDGKEKPIVSYDVRLKEPVDLTLYYSFVGTKRN